MTAATVVVVTWDGREHLEALLPALLALDAPAGGLEIVVVDNGSTDGTDGLLARHQDRLRVVRNGHNAGFARAVNQGVDAARGEIVALLNNDAVPDRAWLLELIAPIAGGEADVVGGRILDWEGGRLQFDEGVLTFDGHAFQKNEGMPLASTAGGDSASPRRVLFTCGGNMAARRSVFQEVGGFDADYFAYFEDVDFGWRANLAGFRVVQTSGAMVRHRGAGTSSRLDPFDRGFLFEVNAFQTAIKNLGEDELRDYLPAILLTLLSRMHSVVLRTSDRDARLRHVPFGPEGYEPDPLPGPIARLLGARGLEIAHPHALSYGRVVEYLLSHLDRIFEKRQIVQRMRKVSCAEVLKLCEIVVVPTYPGDEELFDSAFFRYLAPAGIAYRRLKEIQYSSSYG